MTPADRHRKAAKELAERLGVEDDECRVYMNDGVRRGPIVDVILEALALAASEARREEREENTEAVDEVVARYPESVFPELNVAEWAEVRAALGAAGYPPDQVAGNLMRSAAVLCAAAIRARKE